MKTYLALPVFALILGGAQASQPTPTRQPLRPVSDCPRIEEINEWYIVDDHRSIIRTGPKRYLVTTAASCSRLQFGAHELMFRASNANLAAGMNRICGDVGETVHSRNQPPCALQSVKPIGKDEFDRLGKQAVRHGNAAEQPPRP